MICISKGQRALHCTPPPALPPLALLHSKSSRIPPFPFSVGSAGEAMTSLGPLPSVETRYAAWQPHDTSGTFHGTPWLWGEPLSPTWPGSVRDGPVPQETRSSAGPAGPAAGGPESKPQVRWPWGAGRSGEVGEGVSEPRNGGAVSAECAYSGGCLVCGGGGGGGVVVVRECL